MNCRLAALGLGAFPLLLACTQHLDAAQAGSDAITPNPRQRAEIVVSAVGVRPSPPGPGTDVSAVFAGRLEPTESCVTQATSGACTFDTCTPRAIDEIRAEVAARKSAGALRIDHAGLASPLAIDPGPDFVTFGSIYAASFSSLFSGGQAVSVTWAGAADVPDGQINAVAPTALKLSSPACSELGDCGTLSRTTDLEVTWTPTSTPAVGDARIAIDVHQFGAGEDANKVLERSRLACTAAVSAGKLTIPSALLASLPTTTSSRLASLSTRSSAAATAAVGAYDVALRVDNGSFLGGIRIP